MVSVVISEDGYINATSTRECGFHVGFDTESLCMAAKSATDYPKNQGLYG
jgi:hypothetical protein